MPTARFAKVSRPRAYQVVVAQVEEAILRGELRPGDRLPSERELCTQLGVSRPTVREAMRALENAGMVRLRPNDPNGGAIVRLPGGEEFERSLLSLVRFSQISLGDLVGFRMMIETAACYLAAHTDDATLIDSIIEAHEAVERVADGPDAAFIAADIEFHVAVAKASGNRMLELCTHAVKSAMATLIGDAMVKTEGRAKLDFVKRHAAIVDAIKENAPGRAAACARQDIVDYYVPLLAAEDVSHVYALRALVTPESSESST